MEDLMKTVEQLLCVRDNIYHLMYDAKITKANGKYFAYKKCYNMVSSTIHPLNEQLPPEMRKKI